MAKVTVSKANLIVFCFCWALPRSLLLRCFALRRNANLAGGFAGRFGCGGFVVFCLSLVRDDLPKFLDHTCPCTLVLFIAYAIVRTEPSATSAKPEEKNKKDPLLCNALQVLC